MASEEVMALRSTRLPRVTSTKLEPEVPFETRDVPIKGGGDGVAVGKRRSVSFKDPMEIKREEAAIEAKTGVGRSLWNKVSGVLREVMPKFRDGKGSSTKIARELKKMDTSDIEKPVKTMDGLMTKLRDVGEKDMPAEIKTKLNKLGDDFKNEFDAAGDDDAARDRIIQKHNEALDQFIKDNNLSRAAATSARFTRYQIIGGLLGLSVVGALIFALGFVFSRNNGCWQYKNGVKSERIDRFDFTDNKQFCACGPDNPYVTNLDSCPPIPADTISGQPGYITCPNWNYPKCTVIDENGNLNKGDGLYYSYYSSSPLGEINNLIDEVEKLTSGGGGRILQITRWIIFVVAILMSMFLVYKGVSLESIPYYVASGVILIGGMLSFWFIGTRN